MNHFFFFFLVKDYSFKETKEQQKVQKIIVRVHAVKIIFERNNVRIRLNNGCNCLRLPNKRRPLLVNKK